MTYSPGGGGGGGLRELGVGTLAWTGGWGGRELGWGWSLHIGAQAGLHGGGDLELDLEGDFQGMASIWSG